MTKKNKRENREFTVILLHASVYDNVGHMTQNTYNKMSGWKAKTFVQWHSVTTSSSPYLCGWVALTVR